MERLVEMTEGALDNEGLSRSLQRLAEGIDRGVEPGQVYRSIGPVTLFRAFEPLEPMHVLCTPLLCVVAQGCKEAVLGGKRFFYEPGQIFLNSLTVPTESSTLAASPEHPCLWMTVDLDYLLVSSVLAEAELERSFLPVPIKTMEISFIERPVLYALVRLTELFERPETAPFLMPLILREIVYHLLTGEQGTRLRQTAFVDAPFHPVLRAVEWLNHHFSKPLLVQNLAREAGMSPSSLHQHFKAITSLTPLEYQRQMRLHEARRLMVKEGVGAASAGQRVGYDDPSHFSREYRRFFGAPPRRHVEELRGSGEGSMKGLLVQRGPLAETSVSTGAL
jgi:AraC-like DNA-binding protein